MQSEPVTRRRVSTPLRLAAALALQACGPSEAACTEACARPYALAREEGALQAAAYAGFPDGPRAEALAVHTEWLSALGTAERDFAAQCVPACRSRSADVVSCLQRAQNTGEWKACGKP